MAKRHWYARIETDEGSWFGRFESRERRDEFCGQSGIWVMRNPYHDWRGNVSAVRERIPARITPALASDVGRNGGYDSIRDYD